MEACTDVTTFLVGRIDGWGVQVASRGAAVGLRLSGTNPEDVTRAVPTLGKPVALPTSLELEKSGPAGPQVNWAESTFRPRWVEPALGRVPLLAWAGKKGEAWTL